MIRKTRLRTWLLLTGAVACAVAATTAWTIPSTPAVAAASHRTAARVSSGQDWCQPLKVYLPKPGFQPLRASDSDLRANGFPARPPASQPGALADWKAVVEHARNFLPPHPVCGTTTRSTLYSARWAGHMVPKGNYQNSDIVKTQAQWTQPSVPGNPNYTDFNNAPDASFWDGIGAFHDILQAGCDSIATKTPDYKCWTEDYPGHFIWEGPPVAPGDLMFTSVEYLGGNVTHYYLENETTGQAVSFDNATPNIELDTADFINERVNFPNNGYYLPDYGGTYMSRNTFWQANNTVHELTTDNDLVIMTSNCQSNGTVLSDPSGVSSGGFFLTWEHGSPYTNSC